MNGKESFSANPSSERTREATALLIDWYSANREEYPWRKVVTPYRVWVSEIMLQQTRIEAAKPYFERFIAELPTVQALAEISDERLMKLWQGLGYYSRARNLKKAAQRIVAEYGGELPCDYDALRSLPGIGNYTAGAIASIAFGLPCPAVDGNVLRVMARLHTLREDVTKPSFKTSITAHLRSLYPSGKAAGALTEGVMELGEKICIVGTPHCTDCPISVLCLARASGSAETLPVRAKPKARKVENITVLLLSMNGKYALRKREKGLLSDMWEFPTVSQTLTPDGIAEKIGTWNLCPLSITECGKAKHVFSHVEWEMTGYRVECACTKIGGALQSERLVWATPKEIHENFAVPTAFRAYLKQV